MPENVPETEFAAMPDGGPEPVFGMGATPPPVAPVKPTLRRLFFGDDGLRAGWSVALYLALFVIVAICFNFVIKHFHLIPKAPPAPKDGPTELAPRIAAIEEALQFTLFAV